MTTSTIPHPNDEKSTIRGLRNEKPKRTRRACIDMILISGLVLNAVFGLVILGSGNVEISVVTPSVASKVKNQNGSEQAPLVFERQAPFDNRAKKTGLVFDIGAKDFGGVWSRAFPAWPSQLPLPCFGPNEQEKYHWSSDELRNLPATKVIKLAKTASWMTSGVHLQIA
jgi:hypothetical protein